MSAPGHVWYVAYGSNTLRARFLAYLTGGDGPYGHHRGCADPTPPVADRWVELPHRVAFQGRSQRWGGGVAFLDAAVDPTVSTSARAWLIAPGQLLDVAAQEARLPVAPDAAVLDDVPVGGALVVGGGWYDTVLRLADLDDRPAFTITTGQDLPETEPTTAYRATLAAGLAERVSPRRGGGPS